MKREGRDERRFQGDMLDRKELVKRRWLFHILGCMTGEGHWFKEGRES